MIDKCEKYTNCFDSVCEYAVWRGVVRQAAQSNIQCKVKVRGNKLLRFMNFQFDTLVRLMNKLVQFSGEHAGSIS